MSKKIIIGLLSIIAVFFLAAQACNFGGITSGLAADCVGEGDIICDDTEAYQCQLASYGVGFYVSRASGYDASYCDAVEAPTEEAAFDSEPLARKLISISSDLEDVIGEIAVLQERAGASGDNRPALLSIKKELAGIRATLRDISDVMEAIADEIADASADGEDVTEVQKLYYAGDKDLTEAETLLTAVSVQVTGALEALRGSGTGALVADCSVSPTTAGMGDSITFDGSGSTGADSYSWDFDGDGSEDSTDSMSDSYTYSYSTAGEYTATLTVTGSDGTTVTVDCDSVTVTEGEGCSDTDGGEEYEKAGTVSGGVWYGTGNTYTDKTDFCQTDGKLTEYYCVDENSAYVNYNIACDTVLGSGYKCEDGACVMDSDGDGLNDDEEEIAGTDSTDADSDDDGYSDGDEVALLLDPLADSKSSTYNCYTVNEEWKDYYKSGEKHGTYEGINDEYDDTCSSTTEVLWEYYCTLSEAGNDFVVEKEVVDCTDYTAICSSGACVSACTSDTDCEAGESCYAETGACFVNADDDDGDGLSNYVEIISGFEPATDEIAGYNIINFDVDDTTTYTITSTTKLSTTSSYDTISYFSMDKRNAYTDGTVRVYDVSTSSVGQYIGLMDTTQKDVIYFNDATDLHLTDWVILKATVSPQTTTATFYPLVIKKEDSSICTITSAADYGLWISDKKYQFSVLDSGGIAYSATASDTVGSSWQEVIGIFKDGSIYLFVDGELADTGAGPSMLATSRSGLFVGNLGTGGSCDSYNYHGLIDSFQLWGE